MIQINDKEFTSVVLENKKVVLLDVFATWCGPCKMLAPNLEKLDEANNDWLEVVKADVDQVNDMNYELGVSSVPSLFVYKNGKQVEHFVGYRTVDQLQQIVDKYR